MCTVSMVGDHYRDMWEKKPWSPFVPPWQQVPAQMPMGAPIVMPPEITRAEFDELKRQVEEMKELLKRAKAYDEANGEPECEMDEKMAVLRSVAKMVGIDLDDVLRKG